MSAAALLAGLTVAEVDTGIDRLLADLRTEATPTYDRCEDAEEMSWWMTDDGMRACQPCAVLLDADGHDCTPVDAAGCVDGMIDGCEIGRCEEVPAFDAWAGAFCGGVAC